MESTLGSLTFCNVNTSFQQSDKLQFFDWRCLQGPGPHFPLKYKHIPPELGESVEFTVCIVAN